METLGEPGGAERYFAAVEAEFGRLRGRPLLLAPRDVGLVKQWFEAGIPLRAVRKGLERFFERERRRERPRRRAPSIEYCERDVYEMWEEWQASRVGEEAGEAAGRSAQAQLIRTHLEGLPGKLEEVARRAGEAGAGRVERALGRARLRTAELLAQEATLGELETLLVEEEARVLRAARRELGEQGLADVRREVEGRLGSLRTGLDARAFEVLLRKAEDRTVLARFSVPRIALFAF